jgi:putative pyruvate formate lyase activating enzyme
VDTVDKLSKYVDICLPDLKYHDQRLADRFSSAPRYFETAINAIARMLRHSGQLVLDDAGRAKKGVLIRHLVLPGCVYDTRDILTAIRDRFGRETYLSLMHQFTPQPDGKPPLDRRLTKREYDNAVSACLDLGFTRVFIQEALSATFAYTPEFSDEVTVQS